MKDFSVLLKSLGSFLKVQKNLAVLGVETRPRRDRVPTPNRIPVREKKFSMTPCQRRCRWKACLLILTIYGCHDWDGVDVFRDRRIGSWSVMSFRRVVSACSLR